jgi:hypothetical protein
MAVRQQVAFGRVFDESVSGREDPGFQDGVGGRPGLPRVSGVLGQAFGVIFVWHFRPVPRWFSKLMKRFIDLNAIFRFAAPQSPNNHDPSSLETNQLANSGNPPERGSAFGKLARLESIESLKVSLPAQRFTTFVASQAMPVAKFNSPLFHEVLRPKNITV